MKKIISIIILTVVVSTAFAQTSMPDINRIMKMTPAERQKYTDSLRNALTNITQPNLIIEPPPKDVARLALIPVKPPTRAEMVQQVQKSQSQLQTVLPKTEVAEVEKFAAQNNVEKIHAAAIADFYSNQPEKALWLMMQAAKQQPDSILVWNNLGALYNLTGLAHRAVPLLQHCLQIAPNSSLLLNNLGQSFMSLGDLLKARQYLQQCLDIDSLNPEANHSMGLLHMFAKDFDKAMQCFERELSVAMRMSTQDLAVKMGKKINLRALKDRRDAMNNRPQKDYFSEIHLNKFKLLQFPSNIKAAYDQVEEYTSISTSIGQEALFWMTTGYPSQQEIEQDGKRHHGIYHKLVQALLEELDEEFTPEYLTDIKPEDAQYAIEIYNRYEKELREIKCLKPPPGASLEVQEAYEAKCCLTQHQPVHNKRLNELAAFWGPKAAASHQRWKAYINQLISIVQLDPSLANKLMVYKAVGAYFSAMGVLMLHSTTTGAVNNVLPLCDNYSLGKADSVIESNRKWNLECPAWLNIEVDLGVGKVKADCSKYALEFGKSIIGGYEYEFKTGRSTLLAGVGLKAKIFAGAGSAGIQHLWYVSFDHNNEFADFGTRIKASASIGDTPIEAGPVKIGGTIAGIEGTIQTGINSGVVTKVVGKGILADFIKLDSKSK